MERILVSSCLLGRKVRYNGSDKAVGDDRLTLWRDEGRLVPFCPELAAGFGTPRPPAELVGGGDGRSILADAGGRVVEDTGRDVTDLYLAGAQLALEAARANGCRFAILTDGSPSCGSGFIYDGTFSGRTKGGVGLTTAVLERAGIRVFAETRLADLAALLDDGRADVSPLSPKPSSAPR